MDFIYVFAAVDKDEDKVLYKRDLELYARENMYDEDTFANKWLRLFDTDEDGRITLKEFCEVLGLQVKETEDKLEDARKVVKEREQQNGNANSAQTAKKSIPLTVSGQKKTIIKPRITKKTVDDSTKSKTDDSNGKIREDKTTNETNAENKNVNEGLSSKKSNEQVDVNDVETEIIVSKSSTKSRSAAPNSKDNLPNNDSQQQSSNHENEAAKSENTVASEESHSVDVEYSELKDKQNKDAISFLLKAAKYNSETEKRKTIETELKSKFGSSWLYQINPVLTIQEVNYDKGNIGVFAVDKGNMRVMIWKIQPGGGCCLCC